MKKLSNAKVTHSAAEQMIAAAAVAPMRLGQAILGTADELLIAIEKMLTAVGNPSDRKVVDARLDELVDLVAAEPMKVPSGVPESFDEGSRMSSRLARETIVAAARLVADLMSSVETYRRGVQELLQLAHDTQACAEARLKDVDPAKIEFTPVWVVNPLTGPDPEEIAERTGAVVQSDYQRELWRASMTAPPKKAH